MDDAFHRRPDRPGYGLRTCAAPAATPGARNQMTESVLRAFRAGMVLRHARLRPRSGPSISVLATTSKPRPPWPRTTPGWRDEVWRGRSLSAVCATARLSACGTSRDDTVIAGLRLSYPGESNLSQNFAVEPQPPQTIHLANFESNRHRTFKPDSNANAAARTLENPLPLSRPMPHTIYLCSPEYGRSRMKTATPAGWEP